MTRATLPSQLNLLVWTAKLRVDLLAQQHLAIFHARGAYKHVSKANGLGPFFMKHAIIQQRVATDLRTDQPELDICNLLQLTGYHVQRVSQHA